MAPADVPLVEIVHCPDVFVTGIGRIEKLAGGCLRFVLVCQQENDSGGEERVVVAKIVGPCSNMPLVLRILMNCMAEKVHALAATVGGMQ